MAAPAYAQSADEEQATVADGEETENTIVVTGFRRSLADALEEKRSSGNIVDGINAEDIGKSSDQNIAEALQRVTGVSIDRADGEGTTVTVRGVDANLNNVTLNGVTVTNAAGDVRNGSAGQAVDFSAFSSDLLSRIEVAKTASADDNEGSLGATIRLKTFKPLAVRKDRRVIDLQARYSPFADESFNVGDDVFGGDYRFNVAFSEKLANDTLGISLVATSEKNSGRRDALNIPRYEATNNIRDPFVNGAGQELLTGGITNIETGQLEFSGPNPEDQLRVLLPFEVAYQQQFFETTRNSLTGSIQWKPSSRTDVQLDATYTHTNRVRSNDQIAIRAAPQFFPLWQGTENFYDPENSTLLNYRATSNGFGPGNARNPGYIRPVTEFEDIDEETFVLGFNIEHEAGDFTFNFSGGHSDSKGRDNDYIFATAQIENQAGGPNPQTPDNNSFNGFRQRPGLTKGFDCIPGQICSIFLSDTVANRTLGGTNEANPDLAIIDDAFEFDIGSINSRDRAIDDTASSLFFDVDWDADIGPFTTIEAGFKWEDRNRVQRQTNSFLSRFDFSTPRADIRPFVTGGQALTNGFGERIGLPRDSITDGIVQFDPFLLRTALQAERGDAGITSPDGRDFRDLGLEVYGGYLLANFELANGRVFGDIGARWVKTNVDVAGGSLPSPSFLQFANRPENLEFFGFFGAGDPNNTATLAEAQAAIVNVLGADLLDRNDPGFVDLEAVDASDTFSYDNFLPSLNVNWLAAEDLVIRFAASRTMARPNIDRLRPNFLFNENTFANSFASSGNPQLRPFLSDNLDLSVEWYFDKNSLFSVALYNKNIKDAERTASETFYIRDFRNLLFDGNGVFDPNSGFEPSASSLLLPFTPNAQPLDQCLPNRVLDLSLSDPNMLRECELVQFNRPINAANAFVRGAEVSLQHNFTYLPGLLSGLGFIANYTYADSEVEEQTITDVLGNDTTFRAAPLPNTSRHTFNVTGFYEKDGVQLRVAYNTRSDFLRSSAPELGGTRRYSEGVDSLDVSGGLQITDYLAFNFQAVNLLDSVRRDYAVLEADQAVPNAIAGEDLSLGGAPNDRTLLVANTGRIYRFGLRFTF
ncbi:TonB-dependent receptor [Erythrobacter sp. F6033]|uniref:TonB-dependent receptor n=1 Tax=Erythrobacter sp. F6033 TaxID=2926401 RepID=UPI001FF4230F|nr:TonB-dependent receptor [Erythrobacter sp. F6033]MCK0129278.1 TonB-dependent receptor [Erythrobacter sp. F6033]